MTGKTLPEPEAAGWQLRAAPLLAPQLLAIGSSTGGPNALAELVRGLRSTGIPVPIVLTQHMSAAFTPILAEHLHRLGILPCAEARDGETLLPGCIHLAPGDRHLCVARDGARLVARLGAGEAENFCRPSIDPMLRSAADCCDGRVLAVILTGMGSDGLAGTRHVIDAGGTAIAQDEASSVIWGMPGAIARAGLCHAVLPLSQIADRLHLLLQRSLRLSPPRARP